MQRKIDQRYLYSLRKDRRPLASKQPTSGYEGYLKKKTHLFTKSKQLLCCCQWTRRATSEQESLIENVNAIKWPNFLKSIRGDNIHDLHSFLRAHSADWSLFSVFMFLLSNLLAHSKRTWVVHILHLWEHFKDSTKIRNITKSITYIEKPTYNKLYQYKKPLACS